MFDHRHYVPILKGLAGEYQALREMRQFRSGITPIIDAPPLGWDHDRGEPATTVDEHVRRFANKIDQSWDEKNRIFFDLYMLQDGIMEDGRHPLAYVFEIMRRGVFFGLQAVPVTGLNRPEEYQVAVREIVEADGRGACLRLLGCDFKEDADLESEVTRLLREIGVNPTDVDLVLDLREVMPNAVPMTILGVRAMIDKLPLLRHWRTFTLAGGAFPKNLSDVHTGELTILPRAEWEVWQGIMNSKAPPHRLPSFADYGIRHPDFADPELPARMLGGVPANLRYTVPECWLVLKGRTEKHGKPVEFCDLCRIMVDRREFCGSDYSWGDSRIAACAKGHETNGRATFWTAVATSHHLAFVRSQLANLFGS